MLHLPAEAFAKTRLPSSVTALREVKTAVALNQATGQKEVVKLVRNIPGRRPEGGVVRVRASAEVARRNATGLPQGASLEIKHPKRLAGYVAKPPKALEEKPAGEKRDWTTADRKRNSLAFSPYSALQRTSCASAPRSGSEGIL